MTKPLARITTRKNSGSDVGSRSRLNLIEGGNMSITISDDAVDDEVDITFSATMGTALPGATAFFGKDSSLSGYTNYFYCDGVDDHVQIQAAITYCGAIEDSYTIMGGMGVYDINSSITFIAGDRCIFQGAGMPKDYGSNILTTGGTVLDCADGAQITGGTSASVDFRDMGFYAHGTYADAWIDLIDNNWVNASGCMFVYAATCPDGNAGNPSSTLTGNCINIGKVSGPPGLTYEWVHNVFSDRRAGSASNSCFICMVVEQGEFIGNSFFPYPAKTLNNPNFMFICPVSGFTFRHNIWYLISGWADAPTGQYYNMYMASGTSKNLTFDHDQFLAAAQIENAHFYTNSGTMYVDGSNNFEVEGGYAPMDVSVGGSGTVYVTFNGRGWENFGTAAVANGGTIAHGLVTTPTIVSLNANGIVPIELSYTVDATNITVYHTSGGSPTITWYARYSRTG